MQILDEETHQNSLSFSQDADLDLTAHSKFRVEPYKDFTDTSKQQISNNACNIFTGMDSHIESLHDPSSSDILD